MIFPLIQDFADALDAMPPGHWRRRVLALLDEAIRRDVHFIARRPTTLFQCLWNTCWWHDGPDAAGHYDVSAGAGAGPPPWALPADERVSTVLERWLADRDRRTPGRPWLRSRRPPPVHLETAQRMVFRGHASAVTSVAVSPDGRRLASGSGDGTVRVWDAADGRERLKIHVGRGVSLSNSGVASLCFAPDGRRLAGVAGAAVCVWDADAGAEVFRLPEAAGVMAAVCFSPDGRRLATAAADQTVCAWDARGGGAVARLAGHAGAVNAVCYSPDGRRLASAAADDTVRVWDVATGAEALRLRAPSRGLHSLCFSPDGRRLAAGSANESVCVWDAATGAEALQFRWQSTPDDTDESGQSTILADSRVTAVCFSPDGRRLATAALYDPAVRVWDAASGAELFQLRGHAGGVTGLGFSPDGRRLASGSADRTVRLWDASGSNAKARPLRGGAGTVRRRRFSPDSRRVATVADDDGGVRVCDVATGAELARLETAIWAQCLSFSPDGRLLARGRGAAAGVWDAATGAPLCDLRGHTGEVAGVHFSPDGRRVASASRDRTVRVWDARTGACLLELAGHRAEVGAVRFSPDGARVAGAAADGAVRVWAAATGAELLAVQGDAGEATDVAFSPNGRRVAHETGGGWVRVWDAATGECLAADYLVADAWGPADDGRYDGHYDRHSEGDVIDLSAYLAGPAAAPWRAVKHRSETVIQADGTGQAVAWFPSSPSGGFWSGAGPPYTAAPDGRTWAWAADGAFHVATLEGGRPLAGYEFYTDVEPRDRAGKNYHDFIRLDDDRILIALGSVVGVRGRLLARLSQCVRDAARGEADVGARLAAVGRAFWSPVTDGFAVLLLCELDTARHQLTVANAGHGPPWLSPPCGPAVEIGRDAAGLPLNMTDDATYETTTVPVPPGSVVLAATEALLDTVGEAGERFEGGWLSDARRFYSHSVRGFGEHVKFRVNRLRPQRTGWVEMTVICFRRADEAP